MSSGPRFVVVYDRDNGEHVEVFFSTKKGAEDWVKWVRKVEPGRDPRVETR